MKTSIITKLICSLTLILFICFTIKAQNTFPATGSAGLGTTSPKASSLLDMESTTQGFLIPRMTTAQRNAINSPTRGLMIFQTDGSVTGFYFYNGSSWAAVSAKGWSLTGNAGTNPSANFIGTTDAQPLIFKVAKVKSGDIDFTSANTSFGYASLYSNSSGIDNTAMGYDALYANSRGNNNIAIGTSALFRNDTGYSNTAVGAGSLYNNSEGNANSAYGYRALYNNTTGSENNAFGFQALLNNTTGYQNQAFGRLALYHDTSGIDNAAIGDAALYDNTSGNFNVAIGGNSLGENTTGSSNVGIGEAAAQGNTTGDNNTALGLDALFSNSVGSSNTALGSGALSNNYGSYNTATGALSLNNNTFTSGTANENTANGYQSLYADISGSDNTAEGAYSLKANTTGSTNVAVGVDALQTNISGSNNTAVGFGSLSETTGSDNTAVGFLTNVGAGFTNSTAIGYEVGIGANNSCVIGNATVTLIGGQVGWSTLSDGRFKKNIQPNIPGLNFITQLNPVSYTLDVEGFNKFSGLEQRLKLSDTGSAKNTASKAAIAAIDKKAIEDKEKIIYTGLIAQDVEQAANKIGYNFSGLHKPQSDKDNYSLDYSSFVMPLIKSVQELSAMNTNKASEIDSLQAQNANLQKQFDDLKALVLSIQQKQNACSPCNDGSVSEQAQSSYSTILSYASTLQQNVPNPFTNSTTIGYTLPEKFTNSQIIITDKSGKTLKAVTVSGSGKGSLTVDGSVLSSGAYQYSLVIDGRLIDTKQMIVAR